MTACSGSTIRLSRFAAATPAFPTLERLFDGWLSDPGTIPQRPTADLWQSLTQQAIGAALPPLEQRADCGLILATTKGDMAALETWMNADMTSGTNLTPPLLADSVDKLADEFGLSGPRLVISTACSSGLTALIEAAMMVQSGEVRRMLVCGADVACGFVRDGFNALKALSPTRCRPFDLRRDGLSLGSAAAACLVTSTRAESDTDGPCVLMEGWGISSDATHLTAPDRDASGLIRAIQQALGELTPGEIDAVFLHGTGTIYNDAMEAQAMRHIFTHAPYLTAAKGFLGHTLGASGVIEIALAACMLRHQRIGAITGLEEPQWPELNFVRHTAVSASLRRILKTASGFGGLNAAIVLARVTRGETQ